MVYVEKFYLNKVINGASHTLRPAFLSNGKELVGFYVSNFQNLLDDPRSFSGAAVGSRSDYYKI